MYTSLCDNLLTNISFLFFVSATETAKTATMATTNSNCFQLQWCRNSEQSKHFRRVPRTDNANYAVLFSFLIVFIITFSSIRGFTVHLNDHSWKQNWGVRVENTWTNFRDLRSRRNNDEDIVCGNSTHFHVYSAAYVRARNIGLSQS